MKSYVVNKLSTELAFIILHLQIKERILPTWVKTYLLNPIWKKVPIDNAMLAFQYAGLSKCRKLSRYWKSGNRKRK